MATNTGAKPLTVEEPKVQENHYQETLRKFFASSPIHGCSYIAKRHHEIEGVIWLSIIAVCIGLCASDLSSVISTYTSQTTAITVDAMHNVTLQFDDVAVCFDVFRSNVIDGIDQNFNESMLNESIASMSSMFFTGGSRAINFSAIPVDQIEWDLVVKATYLMIVSFTDYDTGLFNGGPDNISERAVQLVQGFYTTQNVDFFDLVQEVGKFMCRQVFFPNNGTCTVIYRSIANGDSCIDVCGQLGTVMWIGYTPSNYQDDICIDLNPADVTLFENAHDQLVFLQAHPSRGSIPPNMWSGPTSVPFAVGYGTPEIWVDLRGGDGVFNVREQDGAVWASEGLSSAAGVEIVMEALAMNTSTKTCTQESEAICAQRCVVERNLANYDCWSLFGVQSQNRPPNANVCMNHYADYSTSVIADYLDKCLLSCEKDPCSIVFFQFRQAYTTPIAVAADGANFTLFQTRFNYPRLSEYIVMSYDHFMFLVGGAIGLWLGASLIAFLHIPIFVFDAYYRAAMRKYRAHVATKKETEANIRETYPMGYHLEKY